MENGGNEEIMTQDNEVRHSTTRNLSRKDILDIESCRSVLSGHNVNHDSKDASWSKILILAFQSIGIVYGDIGTSPLYVYSGTFVDGIKHNDDILGVLSLIIYTLTLILLVKYVFVVLQANDNGHGGTFALYSLICRYAKVGLIPNQQEEDRQVSNFQLNSQSRRTKRASRVQSTLENSKFTKFFLLFATLLGTSMVIGDGVLTPCISVLSAVVGIREAAPKLTDETVVWISIAILICLFMVQQFGTDKVAYSFAPILCIWFAFIGGIGVYNFVKYDPTVLKALNPKYIIDYFTRNKKDAWISLGGVVLAITGAEALFADVGHFTVRSIQISMCSVTFPSLILAYTGQASFLRKHNNLVGDTFYKSIPGHLYWPMFVVAVLASIIASQAMISGTFSIIQQSLALGCFPRVKVVHTSAKYEGQVFIPEVNYILMFACVIVTAAFKTTAKLNNAFGLAVIFVMTITSGFLVLVMIMIWKTNILLVIGYAAVIGVIEVVYLSAALYKFDQGAYLPIAFAGVLMAIMYVWNSVYRRKYYYELDHKISPDKLQQIASRADICRAPGLAMFYSELVQGIPPIFKHYVENIHALPSVLVFVTIKGLPVSKVSMEERFLFCRMKHENFIMFRCIVRYGYNDVQAEQEPFENILIGRLKKFMVEDHHKSQNLLSNGQNSGQLESFDDKRSAVQEATVQWEMEEIDKAWDTGVVHLIGDNEIIARKEAGVLKRILIDYAYNFLRKNLRQSDQVFDIPHKRTVKVGMTYEL